MNNRQPKLRAKQRKALWVTRIIKSLAISFVIALGFIAVSSTLAPPDRRVCHTASLQAYRELRCEEVTGVVR